MARTIGNNKVNRGVDVAGAQALLGEDVGSGGAGRTSQQTTIVQGPAPLLVRGRASHARTARRETTTGHHHEILRSLPDRVARSRTYDSATFA